MKNKGTRRRILFGFGPLAITAMALIFVHPSWARADTTPLSVPQGMKAGSFTITPRLTAGYFSDDNIYSTEENAIEDTGVRVDTELLVASDWKRHALNFSFLDTWVGYTEYSVEDYNDIFVAFDGRLDVWRRSFLAGGYSHGFYHEDRGSPDDVGGKEPTLFTLGNAFVSYTHALGVMSLKVEAAYQEFAYDDTPTYEGPPIDNSTRNRTRMTYSATLGYLVTDLYAFFVRAGYNERVYDVTYDKSGYMRSSAGYETVAGLSYLLSGVTNLIAFLGYQSQEYDDERFNVVEGFSYGLTLKWTPNPLYKVTAQASNTIEETTLAPSPAYFSSNVIAQIDYHPSLNFLISGGVLFSSMEYEQIERKDDLVKVNVGANYYFNRRLFAGVEYIYDIRDSTVPGDDFTRGIAMLRVGAQF